MAIFHLSPPWNIFYSEVRELFKHDKEVHVVYDEAANVIKLYVDEDTKADALAELLPEEKVFGNVVIKIEVVPANGCIYEVDDDITREELFDIAFGGNPIYAFSKTIQGIFPNGLTYVVFEKTVVQYWTDNLGDYYGQCSTLYQEIAKDVFGETEGIFYCTDVDEGCCDEWP